LLVAQGKTNREIAEALILNKRTVESYLDHIFLKLNFSSRVQLAAWVFERGGLVQNT
jgi:DNA-binding NarL/FixJ family response regulator